MHFGTGILDYDWVCFVIKNINFGESHLVGQAKIKAENGTNRFLQDIAKIIKSDN